MTQDPAMVARIEAATRKLLGRMVREKVALEPLVGADGRVHYPLAENLLNAEGVENPDVAVRAWIAEMASSGVLKTASMVEIAACPLHLRADPLVQLECANCKGRSMRRISLIQHVYCGFIGNDERFKMDGVLKCPNCQRAIATTEELRAAGVWYECPTCLSKSSTPKLVFICRDTKHEYTIGDIVLLPIYSYVIVDKVSLQLTSDSVLVPSIAEVLTNLGYYVSFPASVKGQSGVTHALDLYAQKAGDDIAIQIIVDKSAIDAVPVMGFFAKTYDIKPKLSVLVAIPSASDVAKQVSGGYRISLIEDKEGNGVVDKVRALLQARKPD